MKGLYAIYLKELYSFFVSWMGWILLIAFLGFMGFFFFSNLLVNQLADLRGFFGYVPIFFLVFGPAVSMRLVADEKKVGSLEILLTLPVQDWQVIVGKYLAAVSYIVVSLLLTFTMPLTVVILGATDLGPVWSGYFGSFLLGSACVAIGLFASSLVKDQVLAFIIGAILSLVFVLMGIPSLTSYFGEKASYYMNEFSLLTHFNSMGRGIIDTRDVFYFLSVIVVFLLLSVVKLESRKW